VVPVDHFQQGQVRRLFEVFLVGEKNKLTSSGPCHVPRCLLPRRKVEKPNAANEPERPRNQACRQTVCIFTAVFYKQVHNKFRRTSHRSLNALPTDRVLNHSRKYYYDDQRTEDETGRTCSAHEEDRKS
jgi:hypothetical protein